jgi:hypothetical protein
MKHCFQMRFAYLLAIILLCACASSAAEVKTWQLSEEGTTIYYEMTKFDEEMPVVLLDAMTKTRWAGWQCEKGIRQDKRKKDSNTLIKGSALAAVQKDGKTMLLQFVCPDGKTWSCFPAADGKALLPGRSYDFDAVLAKTFPHVEIIYPCGDGGCEKFRLILTYTEKEPVIFENYIREYADGSELIIGSGKKGDSFFRVETTSSSGTITVDEDVFYFYPKWLEALDASLYPKSREEVQNYIAANPCSVPNGYGLLSGSNMREKTSTQSKKLGNYHNATLVKILGIEPGTSNPWYKVQAGQTVGFISEPYSKTKNNEWPAL